MNINQALSLIEESFPRLECLEQRCRFEFAGKLEKATLVFIYAESAPAEIHLLTPDSRRLIGTGSTVEDAIAVLKGKISTEIEMLKSFLAD